MKIRSDFVTNSSSTSFIMLAPEEITSEKQLKKYVPNATQAHLKAILREMLSDDPKGPAMVGAPSVDLLKLVVGAFWLTGKCYKPTARILAIDKEIACLLEKLGEWMPDADLRKLIRREKDLIAEGEILYSELRDTELEEIASEIAKSASDWFIYHADFMDEQGPFFSELEWDIVPNSSFPFIAKESNH